MIYKSVEKIQEKISCIGIGCWNFGGDWDSSAEENSIAIVHAAMDFGINFFDVAPVYGWGCVRADSGQGAQAGWQT